MMKKWEYERVYITENEGNTGEKVFFEKLNALGNEGWRIIHTVIIQGNPWAYYAVLERQKIEEM